MASLQGAVEMVKDVMVTQEEAARSSSPRVQAARCRWVGEGFSGAISPRNGGAEV